MFNTRDDAVEGNARYTRVRESNHLPLERCSHPAVEHVVESNKVWNSCDTSFYMCWPHRRTLHDSLSDEGDIKVRT